MLHIRTCFVCVLYGFFTYPIRRVRIVKLYKVYDCGDVPFRILKRACSHSGRFDNQFKRSRTGSPAHTTRRARARSVNFQTRTVLLANDVRCCCCSQGNLKFHLLAKSLRTRWSGGQRVGTKTVEYASEAYIRLKARTVQRRVIGFMFELRRRHFFYNFQ